MNGARPATAGPSSSTTSSACNYAEAQDVDIVSNFVTWESEDGLRYRFNQKETRNGEVDEEIRGEANLDGPGKGGMADFEKPKPRR